MCCAASGSATFLFCQCLSKQWNETGGMAVSSKVGCGRGEQMLKMIIVSYVNGIKCLEIKAGPTKRTPFIWSACLLRGKPLLQILFRSHAFWNIVPFLSLARGILHVSHLICCSWWFTQWWWGLKCQYFFLFLLYCKRRNGLGLNYWFQTIFSPRFKLEKLNIQVSELYKYSWFASSFEFQMWMRWGLWSLGLCYVGVLYNGNQ